MTMLFPDRAAPVIFEAEVDSTNTRLKAIADHAADGTVIAAGRQSGGRGRLGRSFASPEGGVYLSILLAPKADLSRCLTLTPTAAVAVRRAIKRCCGISTDIKWPNDLQLRGKKLCGILTEAVSAGGEVKIIIGIGVNLNTRAEDFPPELRDSACSVFSATGSITPPETLIRALTEELDAMYALWLKNPGWALDEYRASCATLGQRVRRGKVCGRAAAVGDDFALYIQSDDGSTTAVTSGEVLTI